MLYWRNAVTTNPGRNISPHSPAGRAYLAASNRRALSQGERKNRGRRDSRFCRRDRQPCLAPKLEGNLLDGGGLGEGEDDMAAEEGGVDVDAGAAEDEGVGGNEDVEVGRISVLLLAVHVVVVLELVDGIDGLEGGVEGGDEGVLVRVGVHVRAGGRGPCEDERHGGGQLMREGGRCEAG